MKTKLAVLVLLIFTAPSVFALGGVSVGPYYGMAIPVVNDAAKTGMMYGLQAKLSLMPMLSVGAHYSSRSYGNPSLTFFEDDPNYETIEMEVDGGDVTSLGIDAFVGKIGSMPGVNTYFMGSFSTFKWERTSYDEVSKTAFLAGLGAEIVLPMKLGIEGRGMVEIASTGNGGTYKALLWFIGVNYHIGLGPM